MLVRHLAATEPQCDLHLVASLEEFANLARLHLVVVIVDIRAEFQLFKFSRLLLLAGSGLLFLSFETELAIINDLADGNVLVRGNFNKV